MWFKINAIIYIVIVCRFIGRQLFFVKTIQKLNKNFSKNSEKSIDISVSICYSNKARRAKNARFACKLR